MAYERYGTREPSREERSRLRDERYEPRNRGYSGREERGFFDRAGDEVASWFGDDAAERRRREDQRADEREPGRGWSDDDRGRFYGQRGDRDRGRQDRDEDEHRSAAWTGRGYAARERGERDPDRERGYRPGDSGRGSDQFFAASGYGREDLGRGRDWREREPRDEYRRTGSASATERERDPHYRSWRQRHLSELDRDYDDYRSENQSRFESDFGSWRVRRMQKRGLLGQIREHMEVVGSDDQHVGTVDRVAGDRLILTKSDPDSGGVHHSLSCSDVDRVEGDRVTLDLSAEQAMQRWRDESRDRALFEREDQGEMGPRMLGRSFEGTYR